MIRQVTSLPLLAALIFATAAGASEPPAPRAPIGPRELPMLPDPRNPLPGQLSEDRIRIVNQGNQRLFFAYWDGSNWQQNSVDAGLATEASCAKCNGTITVAFHNGKESKRYPVRGGRTYVLRWDAQAGAWNLVSSQTR